VAFGNVPPAFPKDAHQLGLRTHHGEVVGRIIDASAAISDVAARSTIAG